MTLVRSTVNCGSWPRARRTLGVFTALAITLAPMRARAADEAGGAEFFRAGQVAYEKGDYRAAALAFEEAHRRAPRGATIYNAALAWDAVHDDARAADDYQAALDAPGLSAQQATNARARLATLEPTLGRIDVVGPTGTTVSVAHVTKGSVPRHVHVAPGNWTVSVVFATGATAERSVLANAGAPVDVEFTAPPAPPVERGEPEPTRDAASSGGSSLPTLGWIALGTSAVAAGTAAWLGLRAVSARNDFDNSGRVDVDAHDRAVNLRTWTNVAWAGAGALAVTGVVLLVLAPKKSTEPSTGITTAIAVGPSSIGWIARF